MFIYLNLKTKNISSLYIYLHFLFLNLDNYVLVLKQLKKKNKKKFTVLKSPHVNKKAKESFESCIYIVEMLLHVFDLNIFINKFNKIRNNIFLDLIVKIKLLHFKVKKLKNLNSFLVKKCLNSKYLKLLDIVGEINLNN